MGSSFSPAAFFSLVALNPQPQPPGIIRGFDPQPDPPGSRVLVSPQPSPPRLIGF